MRENYFEDGKWWVSPYNFEPSVRAGLDLPEKVEIHDATLRDGEQTPGVVFSVDDKLAIATKLDTQNCIHSLVGHGRKFTKELHQLSNTQRKTDFTRCSSRMIQHAHVQMILVTFAKQLWTIHRQIPLVS